MSAARLAVVAVARPVGGEYTYAAPEALVSRLLPGVRVRVPFGRGTALAFFLGFSEGAPASVLDKLKPIDAVLDDSPSLTPDVVALVRFAALHYRYPLGEALKAALPPGLSDSARDEKAASPDTISWAQVRPDADPSRLARAPAQQAVVSYLLAVGGRAMVDELEHALPGAKASLKRLAERGLVTLAKEVVAPTVAEGLGSARHAQLTDDQQAAVQALTRAFDERRFQPFLLHGVTGSGKTEVYLQLVEHARAAGRGALVLVPEIALTPQLVGRFRARFGPDVAVLHSALKDRERLVHWQALRKGAVRIAVGVRSAIFAPVPDLGVVVVDEEHDGSFKQEDKLRYHARDLAVVRAQKADCLVVLGSATPSLETLENARRGRYAKLTMPKRVDDRPMPKLGLVDLRAERPRTPESRGTEPPVLSAPLRAAIAQTLERGQQAILFLNRRGHATYIVCEVCGQSLKCANCDVCLTLHQSSRRLICHYCGDWKPKPAHCPECDGALLELGVGTQRIEAEVADAFPGARVARLDRDAVTTAERLTDLLASFARREIDVLVGTQMVAKGHDFPGVTLVAVVLADSALALPDFRAAERTFQLLTQVAGRAGRGKDEGQVLVQSYNPDAPPIARMLAQDYDGFCEDELKRRKALAWPPFARLAALRVDGTSPELTARLTKALAHALAAKLPPPSTGVRILGPAPSPLSRLKGRTRWQVVLSAPTHALLQGLLATAEALARDWPTSVRLSVDVDPVAML